MADRENDGKNLDLVRRYLAAVADPAETPATLGRFMHDDMIFDELPNAVVPRGARRDRSAIAAAWAKGAQVITGQRYDVIGAVAEGDRVAVEIVWTGTLAVPYGERPAGSVMRAHVGAFFELRDGRIFRQRNYDCYEPA
jgi:ketosteroid isomerase-like protein